MTGHRNSHAEPGPSDHNQLEARFRLAFESSFSIFQSDQVTSHEFGKSHSGAVIEELQLILRSNGNDALSRLGVGYLEGTYVGSAEDENGFREPETMIIATRTVTGEQLAEYQFMHDIETDAYMMTLGVDESSPLFESILQETPGVATDEDVLEYLSVVDAAQEKLTYGNGVL